jgi:hypothetical protein
LPDDVGQEPLETIGIETMDRRSTTVNGKKETKKKGALRPWLVDVSLDHLR